ncbi:hypothetical protein ACEPPN_006477 [Leptodophora sp. 'Broadleaf-Isolate-01']
MGSLVEDLTRLSRKVSCLCRILDEELLNTTPASEEIRKVGRHLTFIAGVPALPDVVTEDLVVILGNITQTISKALDCLLEEAPLTKDVESRLVQLETSPTLLLEVKDTAWREFGKRLDHPAENLY